MYLNTNTSAPALMHYFPAPPTPHAFEPSSAGSLGPYDVHGRFVFYPGAQMSPADAPTASYAPPQPPQPPAWSPAATDAWTTAPAAPDTFSPLPRTPRYPDIGSVPPHLKVDPMPPTGPSATFPPPSYGAPFGVSASPFPEPAPMAAPTLASTPYPMRSCSMWAASDLAPPAGVHLPGGPAQTQETERADPMAGLSVREHLRLDRSMHADAAWRPESDPGRRMAGRAPAYSGHPHGS